MAGRTEGLANAVFLSLERRMPANKCQDIKKEPRLGKCPTEARVLGASTCSPEAHPRMLQSPRYRRNPARTSLDGANNTIKVKVVEHEMVRQRSQEHDRVPLLK